MSLIATSTVPATVSSYCVAPLQVTYDKLYVIHHIDDLKSFSCILKLEPDACYSAVSTGHL